MFRSDGSCAGEVREQFNLLTAFLDGGQVYGSDIETSKKLRSFVKGKMKTHKLGPTLPTRSQTGNHFHKRVEILFVKPKA